jgi:hypothetical protein
MSMTVWQWGRWAGALSGGALAATSVVATSTWVTPPATAAPGARPATSTVATSAWVTPAAAVSTLHVVPTTNLLARYVAGQGVTVAGIGVSQWDDLSGNGHHATQATNGNRPVPTTVLGTPSLRFDGGKSVDLPATLTVDRQDCAIFVCYRARSLGASGLTLVHFDSNSLDLSLYLATTTGTVRPALYSGSDKGTTIRNGHGIQTVGAICSASDVAIVHDGETQAVTANSAGSFSGGFIGKRHDGTNHFVGDIYEVLVYDAAISDADRDAIRAAFAAAWGASSPLAATWIGYEGDSLTDNNANSNKDDSSWPMQLASTAGLAAVPKWFNNAVGGDQLQGMLSQTLISTELAANAHYANRVVFLWAGFNDIGTGGRTSTQINADLDTWVADHQAAGAVVYVCTLPPYPGFNGTQQTYRTAVNTHITTTLACDGVIDLAGDSRLQTPSDTTYFLGDQIHLTATGNAVVAELALARLVTDGYLGYGSAAISTTAAATWTAPAATAAPGARTTASTVATAAWTAPASTAAPAKTTTATVTTSAWTAPAATAAPGAVTTTSTVSTAAWTVPAATAAPGVIATASTVATATWATPTATAAVEGAATATPATLSWVVPTATVTAGAVTASSTAALATWVTAVATANDGSIPVPTVIRMGTITLREAITVGTIVTTPEE